MCERYARFVPPDALAVLFGTLNPVPDEGPSWNLTPGRRALIVRRDPPTGLRHLMPLRWGLTPPKWMKEPPAHLLFAARAEQVATSAVFRAGFAVRRCLVPADAFYVAPADTSGAGRAYAVARRDGRPMAFAGFWDLPRPSDGTTVPAFAVITTPANAVLRPLGRRMPAILEAAQWSTWLDETPGDVMELLRPPAPALLAVWPVAELAGGRGADGPAVLAPAAGGESYAASSRNAVTKRSTSSSSL
jgi:putative SOS response-associated peptidase YedK